MHPDDLSPPATVTHTLAAGQCLSLQLRRGDWLWLAQGRLQARPPAQWLGERLWQPVAVWAEGHQDLVQDAGDVVVETACADAEVVGTGRERSQFPVDEREVHRSLRNSADTAGHLEADEAPQHGRGLRAQVAGGRRLHG